MIDIDTEAKKIAGFFWRGLLLEADGAREIAALVRRAVQAEKADLAAMVKQRVDYLSESEKDCIRDPDEPESSAKWYAHRRMEAEAILQEMLSSPIDD